MEVEVDENELVESQWKEGIVLALNVACGDVQLDADAWNDAEILDVSTITISTYQYINIRSIQYNLTNI
jgi:hypothetical protein